MSLLISTQSYQNDVPTPYGLLVSIDDVSGELQETFKIETPVDSINEGGRLKPGLRGLFKFQDRIYTASWNTIFILENETFKLLGKISHKWMSDLHGIFVDNHGIWVTSSYPDAVILYDFNGNVKASLWMPETKLYQNRTVVDKEMDWRFKGKDFRGFREYHVNHVEVKNDKVFVTGRGNKNKGRVVYFDLKDFLSKPALDDGDLNIMVNGLFGPHDGLWVNGSYWVTETKNSSIASLDSKGRILSRKKITETEEEPIRYSGLKDLIKYQTRSLFKKSGKMVTHWTRGLCISEGSLYVGQSTWAGDEHSKARVVKLSADPLKIINCFYLDIPNYPEARIYQIIKI
jgi:hypothetical protein